MGKIYHLDSAASDLSGGADFSKKMLDDEGATGNFAITIAGSATETSYGFTEPSNPGTTAWGSGRWWVQIRVHTANMRIACDPVIRAISSTGTVEETKNSTTGSQTFTVTGVYQWAFDSVTWGSRDTTDRIRIDFPFVNSGHSPETFNIYHGETLVQSRIIAADEDFIEYDAEVGDVSDWPTTTGSFTADTTRAYTGAYSYKVIANSAARGNFPFRSQDTYWETDNLRFQFYFYGDSADNGFGVTTDIFCLAFMSSTSATEWRLEIEWVESQQQYRCHLWVQEDSGTRQTSSSSYFTNATWVRIQGRLQLPSTPGNNDGEMTLWVDGSQVGSAITDLNNDDHAMPPDTTAAGESIDRVEFGSVAATVGSDTTFWLDNFVVRNYDTEILPAVECQTAQAEYVVNDVEPETGTDGTATIALAEYVVADVTGANEATPSGTATIVLAEYTALDVTGAIEPSGTATIALAEYTALDVTGANEATPSGTAVQVLAEYTALDVTGANVPTDGTATIVLAEYTALDVTGANVPTDGTATIALAEYTALDATGAKEAFGTAETALGEYTALDATGANVPTDGTATIVLAEYTAAEVTGSVEAFGTAETALAEYTALDATGANVPTDGTALIALAEYTALDAVPVGEIFCITHSVGDFSEYDAVFGSGRAVTEAAALAATHYGLEFTLNGTTNIWVQKNLVSPESGRLRIRLYFRPGTISLGSGDEFDFFHVIWDTNQEAIALSVENDVGTYKMRLDVREDGGTIIPSGDFTLADQEYLIEIYLEKASSADAEDGRCRMWIDGGSPFADLGSLDVYTGFDKINRVLPRVQWADAGASGTFYIDEICANDSGFEIGPVVILGAAPGEYTAGDVTGANVPTDGTATIALGEYAAQDATGANEATPSGTATIVLGEYTALDVTGANEATPSGTATIVLAEYTALDVTGALEGGGTAEIALAEYTALDATGANVPTDGTATIVLAEYTALDATGANETTPSGTAEIVLGEYVVAEVTGSAQAFGNAEIALAEYTALDATGELVATDGTATIAQGEYTALDVTGALVPTSGTAETVVAEYVAQDVTGALEGGGTAEIALAEYTVADVTGANGTPPSGTATIALAEYTAQDVTGSLELASGTATTVSAEYVTEDVTGANETPTGTAGSASAEYTALDVTGANETAPSGVLVEVAGEYFVLDVTGIAVVGSTAQTALGEYTAGDVTGANGTPPSGTAEIALAEYTVAEVSGGLPAGVATIEVDAMVHLQNRRQVEFRTALKADVRFRLQHKKQVSY